MTTLEETHHTMIFIEHDHLPYDDMAKMMEYVLQVLSRQVLSEAAKEAVVLLYALWTDPYFEKLIKNADRASYSDEGPRAISKIGIYTIT